MTTWDLNSPLPQALFLKVEQQRTPEARLWGASTELGSQPLLGNPCLSTFTSKPRTDENGTLHPPEARLLSSQI